MDLFETIASQGPPRQRSRSLSLPRGTKHSHFTPTREAVIVGDDNLASFGSERTDVLAVSNGRLNYIRTLLRSAKDSFPQVKRFALVVSHLDRRNAHNTNLTAIRNIVGAGVSLFPHAELAVASDGVCN